MSRITAVTQCTQANGDKSMEKHRKRSDHEVSYHQNDHSIVYQPIFSTESEIKARKLRLATCYGRSGNRNSKWQELIKIKFQ